MNADATNPYQPPAVAGGGSSGGTPHGTSIRQEAWRGAKFAAKIMATTLGALACILWLFMLGMRVYVWLSTGRSPLAHVGGIWELLKQLGLTVAVIALTTFYASVAGALVMAIAALIRKFRRPAAADRAPEDQR